MTQVNLFADDQNSAAPPVDPQKNYLEDLVGDGKKFKSPEELARGKYEADQFITQLQSELSGLRQDLNTRLTLEQFMDKIAAPGEKAQTPNEPNGNTGENLQGLKPEDVERLIDQRVSAKEAERIQTENLRTVRDQLAQTLGPDFPNKLKSISSQIGMSEEDMNDMAKLRPKAFMALVKSAEPTQGQVSTQQASGLFTPPTGQQTGFKPTADRTMSYYENIRRTDPKAYWDPKTQNSLHADALRLGEKFFD